MRFLALENPVFTGFFVGLRRCRVSLEQKIEALVTPAIEAMALDFWGCEYISAGKESTLRIYIERPEVGVTVDDCERVSRQVSAIMDVEDPISTAYMLEISSPGLERPLFKPEQFEAYIGHTVSVRSRIPVLGRRRFKGKLIQANQQEIEIEVDGEVYAIPLSSVDKANLVVEL